MSQTAPKRSSKGGTLQLKEISIIPITATSTTRHIQPKQPPQQHAAVGSSSTSSSSSMLAKKLLPQMSEDDVESLRKKRCNDRCDSSESSDSGVITMSIDSQATSDSSDPGSPFSHSSSTHTEEMTTSTTASKSKILLPKAPQKRQSNSNVMDSKSSDKKRLRKDNICATTKSGVEIKLVPVPAQQERKIAPNNSSINFAAAKPQLIAFNTMQSPALTTNSTANISKITDYYKLKKEVTLTSGGTSATAAASVAQQSFKSINASMKSVAVVAMPSATKVAGNINSNQVSVTPLGLCSSSASSSVTMTPSRPIVALNSSSTNNSSSKKPTQVTYEKKTAKIAPIIPVARKTTTTNVHNVKPTKKPVSIAPRLEPKCSSNSPAPRKNSPEFTMMPSSKQMQNLNNQTTTSGPTVLLAAIRIPQQHHHHHHHQPTSTPSQPPPLGLIQKTTTTTTTTKLGPLIQLHHAPSHMLPNIIQIPNLVATSKASSSSSNSLTATNKSAALTQQQQNLYGNNSISNETAAQQMLNAVIKLQAQAAAAAANSQNGTQQKQQQQQQNSFAAQLSSHQVQQLFMASPVLFNASQLPAVLASQLQQHHHHHPFTSSAMPALQPIQTPLISSYASSSMTQTTQSSLHLPSLSAFIQSQAHHQSQQQQQFQTSLQQLPPQQQQQQCFQTLLKSAASAAISMPPSLAFPSHFVQQQQRVNASTTTIQPMPAQQPQPIAAKLTPSKSVPPLAPASNFNPLLQITKNIPKMISVKSSSSQTTSASASPKTAKSPPPLVIPSPPNNQKVSLPKSSPVAAAHGVLKQEICVVPPLPSPAKLVTFDAIIKQEKQQQLFQEPEKDDIKSTISVLIEEKLCVTESAKSPILSQPKTIRFPPVNGKVTVWKKCVKISQKGVCNWAKCSQQFDSNTDLLDHLHTHIDGQAAGPFICSWRDCKVNGREGSRGWLERHIISHVGSTKPFKCIVEKCGMRFGSQTQLQKHVNGHFNGSDQINERKRSSDPLILKKVKKDAIKKMQQAAACNKARRQPWAARRFDFFDIGVVEMLKHRLQKVETVYRGNDMIVTFRGKIAGKRRSSAGVDEYKVTWEPANIFDEEWIKRPSNPNDFKLVKSISLKALTLPQRCALTSYFEQHDNNITSNNSNSRSNGCINNHNKNSRKFKAKSSTAT